MKKYCFFILYFSTHLYAQEYHPLLETNKIWTVEYTDNIVLPPKTWQTSYQYQKDTIIDMIPYSYFLNELILREDTLNKKVYVRDEGYIDNECLLYDFDAQQGDTLHLCGFEIVIDSVSTVFVKNGEKRNVFYYQGTVTGEYYIEGIGSNHGLIDISEPIGPPSIQLMCLKHNDIELYGERCGETTSVSDYIQEQTEISIYPNPTNDNIKIETNLNIIMYKIINNIGKCVAQNVLTENNIELSNLQKGIYVIEFYNKKNKVIGRKRFVHE